MCTVVLNLKNRSLQVKLLAAAILLFAFSSPALASLVTNDSVTILVNTSVTIPVLANDKPDSDLFIANLGDANQVCFGNEYGYFDNCTDISADTNNSYDVANGDLDNDGNVDIVFANGAQTNRICLGDGSGSFTCSDVSALTLDSRGVLLGYFNNDMILDIAFANYGGKNQICLGDGTGAFSCTDIDTATDNSSAVAAGDLNADNYPDLVFANDGQENTVCLGDGSGGFACTSINTDTFNSKDVVLGDFDGGGLDAVFANYDQMNRLCSGNGSGGFSSCTDIVPSGFESSYPLKTNAVGALDQNLDNNLDLVFLNESNMYVEQLVGDGSGSFTLSYSYPESNYAGLTIGYFNSDGYPDAAFVNNSGITAQRCFGNGFYLSNCSAIPDDYTSSNGVSTASVFDRAHLVIPPDSGTAVVNADKTISYTPNPGFQGTDVFYYELQESLASVTVTVTDTIDPPVPPTPLAWEEIPVPVDPSVMCSISAAATFKDHLYIGHSPLPQIYRTADGESWTKVIEDGFGDDLSFFIRVLFVWDDHLYATTDIPLGSNTTYSEVWRTADGLNWHKVFSVTKSAAYTSFYAVFKDELYMPFAGNTIYKTKDGVNWELATSIAAFGGRAFLSVLGDYLYMAFYTDGKIEIWRSADGEAWETVAENSFGYPLNWQPLSFTTFDSHLYLGTANDLAGAEIWRSNDGLNWERVVEKGFGDLNNVWLTRMYPMGSELYAVDRQYSGGTGVELWKSSDGLNWSQVNEDGFGNPDRNAIEPLSMAVFQNQLYFYTGNYGTCADTREWGAFWRSVNHVPVAIDQSTSKTGRVAESILNAVDDDGDALVYEITEQPKHGVVTLQGNIAVYTPSFFFSGIDTFTWRANDGQMLSNTIDVAVSSNKSVLFYLPAIVAHTVNPQ